MSTETRAAVAEHAEDCRKAGAIHEIWVAIESIRKEQAEMGKAIERQRGASEQQARNVTIIAVAATLAQLGLSLWRMRHGG